MTESPTMRFSRQAEILRVRTPAKINLSLHIRGRRPDGYHELQTLMVSIGLSDTLRLAPSAGNEISLRIRSAITQQTPLPTDERNLIVRAARLLQRETGHSEGVEITLWKQIPSEAGMGGGSSDAAAALVGLNQFWNLGLDSDRLHQLAATLGSDLNFFLDSIPAALCTGRGEQIEPYPLPRRLHAVIIKPPFGLSTGTVFQTWNSLREQSPAQDLGDTRTHSPTQTGSLSSTLALQQLMGNDLESAARTLNPKLQHLLSRLGELDLIGSGMTGSGSACFALCRSARHARAIAGRCRNWNVGKVFVTASGVS